MGLGFRASWVYGLGFRATASKILTSAAWN